MMADFAQPSNFEDFFNFDMFAGPSTGPGTSSSRSSSNSPSQSFVALPPTPPTAFEMAFNPDSQFFTDSYLEDDFTKLEPQTIAPMSTTSHGFLSGFPPIFEESSSESSSDSPGTIDPQLVETPATSSRSEFSDEEEEREEEEAAATPDGDDFAALKVGGKGKSRKGTVQSGGVVKKIGPVAEKEKSPATGILSTTTTDPDDWRPTPEEYKKMSSKEKRQLRNKISARNFRVRRKEYISTLEGDIAERDRLLDAIRTELRSTSNENKALRQEIDALKKALLEGRADTPVLPPPAPLPQISAAAVLAGSSLKSPPPTPSPAPKSPMLTPNLHKDLPMSPRLAGRNFWGGNLGLGGITPVHTTFVPDLSSVLSGKPVAATKRSMGLQENINPTLNGQAYPEKTMEISMPMTPFDSFTEMNPFTMKTLDAYRMHLWTRMAQQQAQFRAAQSQQHPDGSRSPSPHLTGLATNLRPHYFAKNSSVLSTVLSGKSAAGAYPSPPSSPATTHTTLPGQVPAKQQITPTPQQAMLAGMASQTLLGKLGSAFWDAFSGGSPANSKLDTDKVRKVLEGKAVLRVVDVDAPHAPMQQPLASASNERIIPPSPRPVRVATPVSNKCDPGASSLEKMIGKLHI